MPYMSHMPYMSYEGAKPAEAAQKIAAGTTQTK